MATVQYDLAREAIPRLPVTFRRSVAVAAAVYEGILTAIRRNDYDNFSRRAMTTTAGKVALAAALSCPPDAHRRCESRRDRFVRYGRRSRCSRRW